MVRCSLLVLSLALISVLSLGQAALPAQPDPQLYVAQQFGPGFVVVPMFPVLTGDLDGDGIEDAAIVATTKNPLLNEVDFHYKVIDPYNTFWGWGDPKVTLQFGTNESEQPRFLLIIHSWRTATAKAKFVVVNLPFEKLSVAKFLLKKKVVTGITTEDRTGLIANLYWNGKQYKWREQSFANR